MTETPHPAGYMRLQVFDRDKVVYDRTVGPDKVEEAKTQQGDAARRVREGLKRTAHVLILDPNTGMKLYEDYWRP